MEVQIWFREDPADELAVQSWVLEYGEERINDATWLDGEINGTKMRFLSIDWDDEFDHNDEDEIKALLNGISVDNFFIDWG